MNIARKIALPLIAATGIGLSGCVHDLAEKPAKVARTLVLNNPKVLAKDVAKFDTLTPSANGYGGRGKQSAFWTRIADSIEFTAKIDSASKKAAQAVRDSFALANKVAR